MSFAVHTEKIKNTNITQILTGQFVDRKTHKFHKEHIFEQILLSRKNRFEIYDLYKNEEEYNYTFLLEYPVFGEVASIEKTKISNFPFDCIVLVIDYAKISFLQYDPSNDDFKIICLYNFENENLSNGKRFYRDPVQTCSSVIFNTIFFLSNDSMMTVLVKKSQIDIFNKIELNEEQQINYLDTVHGENFFDPTFYVNFQEHGVYKIIKFYIPNKENEILDYFGNYTPIEGNDEIKIFILYKENGFKSNLNNLNNLNIEPVAVTNSFLRNKISLASVVISKQNKMITSFEVLFENLDQNSFDFFFLNNNTASVCVVFSPYAISFINLEQRISCSIILCPIYAGVFYNEYQRINQTAYRGDYSSKDLGLDLRGGGYLIISNSQFIFTTSKGALFAFSFTAPTYTSYKIDQIFLQNNKKEILSTLDAPYKFISMPHPGLFLLGSYVSDTVFINYSGNNYTIFNRILNLSPIINFNLLYDRKQTKFAVTCGYDKCSTLNFIYEKFSFYEMELNLNLNADVEYIKSINFEFEIFSRYLIVGLKNGFSYIFENGKNFENITEKILYQSEGKIISCGVMKLKSAQVIVIISDTLIQIFNSFMKHLGSLKYSDLLGGGEKIWKCKLGSNTIILASINNYVLCQFECTNSPPTPNTSKLKINENIHLKYKDITSDLNTQSHKILKFDINHKEINEKNFLVVYRDDNSLDVYDLNSFFTQTNPICLLHNNFIHELPQIISNSEKDFETNLSDLTNFISINNNTPSGNAISTPEEIFFDLLENKILFGIIFKNGYVVFYEIFFYDEKIKMKKIYVEFIQDIDYKDFFFSESNLFIPFDNIAKCAGVLVNIKDHQKVLFEVNGKIIFLEIDNNLFKRNFSCFTQLSREETENGFLIFERGLLKSCFLPHGYAISPVGLIKRNPLGRFPVNLSYFPFCMNMSITYFFFLVEKEMKPYQISVGGGNITVNRFIYFLTFRTEEERIIDQVEFAPNEVIVESRVVELFDVTKNKKKYFALGVNVMDEKGEEAVCKARVQMYEIEKGKFVKVYESESFRGTISMIHSIDGTLIISEGSRIFLYQYIPIANEMKKISVIENKNLVVCSKILPPFIVTGDILESASWIVFKQEGKSYQDISTSTIGILGKDNSNYASTAIDFFYNVEEQKSGCILADENKNLHVFLVTTEGTLNEVADFYVGKKITEIRFCSVVNFNYYSADDGTIGIVRSISMEVYDKLSLLCEFLYNHLPFRGGCNPKGFFGVRNFPYKKELGKFIEMKILEFYLSMPITTQRIVAKSVLSDRETLIKYISEIKK